MASNGNGVGKGSVVRARLDDREEIYEYRVSEGLVPIPPTGHLILVNRYSPAIEIGTTKINPSVHVRTRSWGWK